MTQPPTHHARLRRRRNPPGHHAREHPRMLPEQPPRRPRSTLDSGLSRRNPVLRYPTRAYQPDRASRTRQDRRPLSRARPPHPRRHTGLTHTPPYQQHRRWLVADTTGFCRRCGRGVSIAARHPLCLSRGTSGGFVQRPHMRGKHDALQAACSAGASSSALASTVSGTVTIRRLSRSNTCRALMTVSPTIRWVPARRHEPCYGDQQLNGYTFRGPSRVAP